MEQTEVLIAGAGPTGLMLALWLARLDIGVRVADSKRGPVQETRAIVVQARTLEFYDQLGLGHDALARGRSFDRLNLFVRGGWRGAVRLNGVAGDLTPHPYLYVLTQDQNEAMLVAALAKLGVQIDWETEVVGLTQHEQGVTVTLKRGDQTDAVRAQYVAGCDGGGSAVRRSLGVRLSGGTYGQRFYVADVSAAGKLGPDDVNLIMDDARFLAFFPMPGTNRHRVVGVLPPDAPEHPDFELVRPDIERFGLAKVQALHWFSAYRVHHRVADTFQQGRAFLLGDAGHVHTPVGGQGMNTGLGDAVNLGWKLAQALRGSGAALSTYEAERRPFALSLVNTTDRVFTVVVNPGRLARFVRTVVAPTLLPVLTRPTWTRRLLFLTVSQTRLHAQGSPLSQGQAGKVRGGQRLPWVPLGTGRDNFGALRTLKWQVQVYGAPGPELLSWCGKRGLKLAVFPFTPQAIRAGLAEDAAYLVRPDGYVGLAAPAFDRAAFDTYADRWLPAGTPTDRRHLQPALAR